MLMLHHATLQSSHERVAGKARLKVSMWTNESHEAKQNFPPQKPNFIPVGN